MKSIMSGIIYMMLLAFAAVSVSCGEEPLDPGTDIPDIPDGETVFPALNSFLPEEDVYKQKKSAKRGIATNFTVSDMPALMGDGVSWSYNWSHNPLSDSRWQLLKANDMTCYPMVWNGGVNANNLATFPGKDSKSEYVLGYNEPNLTDQANMTPAAAAAVWGNLKSAAKNAGLKLVSPAMCYGTLSGYHDPTVWLDEFLTLDGVSLDDMDAIALHAYMPNGSAVKSFIRRFAKYGKPLWLTEFSHANSSISKASEQYAFMAEIITYLEADPAIEKYSWFMDTHGTTAGGYWELIDRRTASAPVLNDLGKLYVNISSFDKTTYYDVDENIPAEHYSGHSIVETAAGDTWKNGALPRVTTDAYGTLEIYNFVTGSWIEYLVDVPASGKYRFDVRYATSRDTEMVLSAENVEDALITLPKTDAFDNWTTLGTEITLAKGKQTIRLTHRKGNGCFNWFRITSPAE